MGEKYRDVMCVEYQLIISTPGTQGGVAKMSRGVTLETEWGARLATSQN